MLWTCENPCLPVKVKKSLTKLCAMIWASVCHLHVFNQSYRQKTPITLDYIRKFGITLLLKQWHNVLQQMSCLNITVPNSAAFRSTEYIIKISHKIISNILQHEVKSQTDFFHFELSLCFHAVLHHRYWVTPIFRSVSLQFEITVFAMQEPIINWSDSTLLTNIIDLSTDFMATSSLPQIQIFKLLITLTRSKFGQALSPVLHAPDWVFKAWYCQAFADRLSLSFLCHGNWWGFQSTAKQAVLCSEHSNTKGVADNAEKVFTYILTECTFPCILR